MTSSWKYLVGILLLLGLSLAHLATQVRPQIVIEPTFLSELPEVPAEPSRYNRVSLGYGGTLRVRENIACYQTRFPELAQVLNDIRAQAYKSRDPDKPVDDNASRSCYGTYESIVLSDNSTLAVYVPDSSPFFTASQYPELNQALKQAFTLAHRHQKPGTRIATLRNELSPDLGYELRPWSGSPTGWGWFQHQGACSGNNCCPRRK